MATANGSRNTARSAGNAVNAGRACRAGRANRTGGMSRSSRTRGAALAMLAAMLVAAPPLAQAGLMDSLFGDSPDSTSFSLVSGRKVWPIAEFSEVRIAPIEPDAERNSHPAKVPAATLRNLLVSVTMAKAAGSEPLFTPDEAAGLAEPLSEALNRAGPGEDVLVRSANKRNARWGAAPLAVTARVFVQGDRLNLIVNDTRNDFYLRYKANGRLPEFNYGSRVAESKSTLQRMGYGGKRGDWLEIPLSGEALPTPPAMARGAAPAAVVDGQAAAIAPVSSVAAPAALATGASIATAPTRPREAASADEVEQRLVTLKRLRDKGLISEEEYLGKRREVLQQL